MHSLYPANRLTTFMVAFAFACPLFLLMREARLRAIQEAGRWPDIGRVAIDSLTSV